jgi:hypothetical protein
MTREAWMMFCGSFLVLVAAGIAVAPPGHSLAGLIYIISLCALFVGVLRDLQPQCWGTLQNPEG